MVGHRNLTGSLALRRCDLGVARHRTTDRELPTDEVHVAPAERDELAWAKTGIGGEPDDLAVLSVLGSPRLCLAGLGGRSRTVAVLAGGERGGEPLDLLRRIVGERSGLALSPPVGVHGRFEWKRVCALTHPKAEDRTDQLAGFVDGTRRNSLGAARAPPSRSDGLQKIPDLARRDLARRAITECRHDLPLVAATSASVWLPGSASRIRSSRRVDGFASFTSSSHRRYSCASSRNVTPRRRHSSIPASSNVCRSSWSRVWGSWSRSCCWRDAVEARRRRRTRRRSSRGALTLRLAS
jgi:hypothetical protein